MNIKKLFNKRISQRDFLKLTGLFAGMAIFNPIQISRFLEKSAELIPPTIAMYHEVSYEFVGSRSKNLFQWKMFLMILPVFMTELIDI